VNTPTSPARSTTADLPVILDVARLPHPNPHGCAHCSNRATLRLTVTGDQQVYVCRPCAARYPR
jgi:hypothetical protein